jgi:hypothetical protein
MAALILWMEWRRRQATPPARIPGGEALVTLGLTLPPPPVEAIRQSMLCLD